MARVEVIGLDQVLAQLDELPGETAGRLMAAIDRQLVTQSPVDTGRFRANWNASADAPQLDNIEPGEYALPTAKEPSAWPNDALILWNTNNLQYASPLAQGSSPQAEAGWVEEAIKSGVSELSG